MQEKNMIFFPTYLDVPNQKIQGRGAANERIFKDGLIFISLYSLYMALPYGIKTLGIIAVGVRLVQKVFGINYA